MIGEPKIKERKVIQISVTSGKAFAIIVALCDDGTMWTNGSDRLPYDGIPNGWTRLQKIPDDKSKFYEEERTNP